MTIHAPPAPEPAPAPITERERRICWMMNQVVAEHGEPPSLVAAVALRIRCEAAVDRPPTLSEQVNRWYDEQEKRP